MLKRLQQARWNGSMRQAPFWKDEDDSVEEEEVEEDDKLNEIVRGLEDKGQRSECDEAMSLMDGNSDSDLSRILSSFEFLDEDETQPSISDSFLKKYI